MIRFTLNGESVAVDAADDMPLLWVIRDKLGLTGLLQTVLLESDEIDD